ncbi:uncharacterized protein [Drosophila virilis]|uniref:Uncharacterized protein n=1 Tax=Drosophila virilis TaxID=7244 RepID=B4MAB7_DROVI|nr:uncharacterized protein LOC6634519 [Drosophila virilis]EDW66176.1 uncharacterized protein Dvir_GJ15880 [Drosophila virilis]
MNEFRMLRQAWDEILQRYLSLEVFSIWHTRNAEQRREYVVQRLIKDWFPWFYWFFLIYSFLGLMHQLMQFLRAQLVKSRPLTMWRVRVFRGIRDSVIRKMRVCGSFFMLLCWFLLFLGLLLNKPKCMRPWISISSLVLALDFVLWTLEIMFGYDQFNWQCLISFALPFICQILLGNIGKLLEDPNHKLFDK